MLLVVRGSQPPQGHRLFPRAAASRHKRLHFGAGNSSSRIAGELLKTATGADLMAVPYKGTPHALTDLMGGQIDFMLCESARRCHS